MVKPKGTTYRNSNQEPGKTGVHPRHQKHTISAPVRSNEPSDPQPAVRLNTVTTPLRHADTIANWLPKLPSSVLHAYLILLTFDFYKLDIVALYADKCNAMTRVAAYNRDRVVAAVREFCVFLTRILRRTAADFQDALQGGWPELTDEVLSRLGKDATVCDLLRHLPCLIPVYEFKGKAYNDNNNNDEDYLQGVGTYCDKTIIVPGTRTIDYPGVYTFQSLAKHGIQGVFKPVGAGVLPRHVAALTNGSRYGSRLLVDTQLGTATDFIMMERPERISPTRTAQASGVRIGHCPWRRCLTSGRPRS